MTKAELLNIIDGVQGGYISREQLEAALTLYTKKIAGDAFEEGSKSTKLNTHVLGEDNLYHTDKLIERDKEQYLTELKNKL